MRKIVCPIAIELDNFSYSLYDITRVVHFIICLLTNNGYLYA